MERRKKKVSFEDNYFPFIFVVELYCRLHINNYDNIVELPMWHFRQKYLHTLYIYYYDFITGNHRSFIFAILRKVLLHFPWILQNYTVNLEFVVCINDYHFIFKFKKKSDNFKLILNRKNVNSHYKMQVYIFAF